MIFPENQEVNITRNLFFIHNHTTNTTHAAQWMHDFVEFRQRLFLLTVEPVIVTILGPGESSIEVDTVTVEATHRRLGFLPSYVSNVEDIHETSMSFATLIMLFFTLSTVCLIFMSCFYHNQLTSPLFISPRRHRLPKLVPPPLPVDGYFSWVKVCFFISDEEIINRIGYDSLIFLRFHRLALRCIVKMSVFSFIVLLPLNFTGGGHAKAQDLKEYVGSLFYTDFLRFTMANVMSGSPRLWVHCFAAYLLTAIVVRELLVEYETFNSIRHRYLLSREPHLRTVLVTNIPRNLRSTRKITSYFKHVYPQAVKSVFMCQNAIALEKMVAERSDILTRIEAELLLLCRTEKKKLYEQSFVRRCISSWNFADCCCPRGVEKTQERLAALYSQLEEQNECIEREQRRRRRVMKMLDRMESGEGSKDIDYVLASPYVSEQDPQQRKALGLPPPTNTYSPSHQQQQTPQQQQQPHSPVTSGATLAGPSEDDEPTITASGSYRPPNLLRQPESIPEEDVFRDDDEDIEDQILSVAPDPSRSKSLSSLRSRSPPTAEGKPKIENYHSNHKHKKPAFHRAKHAIRRYERFNRDVTFLGRPKRSMVEMQADGQMEDHLNEVTDKAFVVMRTYTAATIAIQSMHSSKPGSMQVSTAPEPRDILWDNIYMSKGAQRTRSYIGEFVVKMLICFYVVPIATVSLLVSESALVSSSPRLAQLDQASTIFSVAIAMVQPICIVGLQQLLPPLFVAIGEAEGRTSFSEVQMHTFSRYFLFQVLNVFLVTAIAGTIFDTIAIILEKPESAFEMLGNSLPRLSSFFITFVTIKTLSGLGFELVRIVAVLQAFTRFMLMPNATLRNKRNIFLGMRPIDDPGWFPFHKILAQDMLVVVISVVFAVVAPLVLFPCAIFCLFSRVMWTHQHLYVYESCFESGGMFWPKIFRRFVFGLIIAQMTITGQFILKEARHEAYATMALMFMTYFFLRSTRARYDPTSSTLPLEVATVMDITLQQEEDAKHRQESYSGELSTRGTKSEQEEDPGRYIGRHDPFRKAYLQPALRANARARPEQPFPAAQLGREDTFFSNTDGQQDSAATVRVKTLNQNERLLVDRWWKDQFQRAGKQNTFMVLIGEECGTLSLSGHTEEPARSTVGFPVDGHNFV